jgi:hypothetical protein
MEKSFNKATHRYLIDGKPATGVTTVIGVLAKPALIGWAAKMAVEHVRSEYTRIVEGGDEAFEEVLEEARCAHTKKKEAAGTHGTDAHAFVEVYVNDCLKNEGHPQSEETVDDGLYPPTIRQFIKWAHENVDHFLFAERQMYDAELFIAGTADFAYIGKDGKKYMADFKTSSGVYGIDYWLQTAAYRMLAEGEGDAPYDGCVVVRLGKDGSFEVLQLEEYVLYKEAFLACLKLYRLQAHNKPVVKEKVWGKKV